MIVAPRWPTRKENAVVLRIALSPELEAKLLQRAQAAGQEPAVYAASLLDAALGRASLSEVFAPAQRAFEESGMTEDQLGDLLEEAKHRMRQERRARQGQ
jgi:hypothetical protein